MNKFLQQPTERKIGAFTAIGKDVRLSAVAVEKDWWVTIVLRALFALPYAENLSFKGGTSLSKCWNVIQRFSEDVGKSKKMLYHLLLPVIGG